MIYTLTAARVCTVYDTHCARRHVQVNIFIQEMYIVQCFCVLAKCWSEKEIERERDLIYTSRFYIISYGPIHIIYYLYIVK